MRTWLRPLILLALLLPACGSDDDPAGPGGDTTAPAAVVDLTVTGYDATTATVIWTTTGDDGHDGTAAQYRIGYSPSPISEANWSGCTMLADCPDPFPAGAEQSAQIATPPTPDLYVALRSADEAGNWSALSNVAHARIAHEFEVVQLTFSGDNRWPCLDDGHVTWVGWQTLDQQEIWIANLDLPYPSPTVLTDNGGQKKHPSSHGAEKIVWMGRESDYDDWEIWVYSPAIEPRYRAFTDNSVPDGYPSLAGGGNFAWLQGHTMYESVHYWNEGLHSESVISDACCPTDRYSNNRPIADDYTVVWGAWDRTGSTGNHAWMWNGSLREITGDIGGGLLDSHSLDEGALAYEWAGSPNSIKYWDGTSVHDIHTGEEPSLDDGWIAFSVRDGHDWEIWLWDGVESVQITDNDFDDFMPTLSGNRLAWAGRPTGASGAYQIFFTRLPDR